MCGKNPENIVNISFLNSGRLGTHTIVNILYDFCNSATQCEENH